MTDSTANGSTEKKAEEPVKMEVEEEEPLDEEILRMSASDIKSRTQLLDNEIKIMRSEVQRINHGVQSLKERIKENTERIKVNKTLPYLVSNVVELLELEELQEEEGANVDLDAHKTKCAVIKTSTRATYFLPVVGLVDPKELKPGDLVGVNKDSYLVLEKLPAEYDSRVKAMEVDERPTEQYSDIGGCDKQIQELIEAVVLPMTHRERFVNLGIHPPFNILDHRKNKIELPNPETRYCYQAYMNDSGTLKSGALTSENAGLARECAVELKRKSSNVSMMCNHLNDTFMCCCRTDLGSTKPCNEFLIRAELISKTSLVDHKSPKNSCGSDYCRHRDMGCYVQRWALAQRGQENGCTSSIDGLVQADSERRYLQACEVAENQRKCTVVPQHNGDPVVMCCCKDGVCPAEKARSAFGLEIKSGKS